MCHQNRQSVTVSCYISMLSASNKTNATPLLLSFCNVEVGGGVSDVCC